LSTHARGRRRGITALALLFLFIVPGAPWAQSDPLPSWNAGTAKQSIFTFIQTVTDRASSQFVPPEQRIATFDNDGTLWAEQPIYFQFAFALERVKALAPKHPGVEDEAAVQGGTRRRHEGPRRLR